MKFKDILAISGKPGLFIFVSQGRSGIIVEGVADKKRMAVHSTTKVSALEDIAIYTETEEVPLKEVFVKIYEKEDGKQTISHKSSNDELKSFFEEILPDYDKDRVYVSDIKKLANWYNLLIENKIFSPEMLKEEEEEKKQAEEKAESKEEKTEETKMTAEKKPATKKPAAKKTNK
ncbi:MAG: DUF5606 domain-containing protein [Bacteroidales bacterium]|nr:DUF5606 domain-containing protein [Bacteroidales bacterium]MBN2819674.1 DUF5606 domain-containing protein [Bacteroidales bacterium]